MKKTNKPHALKVFNDNKTMAYKKAGGAMNAYKKSLKKAQDGSEMSRGESKPIGANVSFGNFSGGVQGNIADNKISNTMFNAGYTNPKTGLGVNASYTPDSKKISAGINYNTTVGKNKIPLKLGVNYNKKGGTTKTKK